MSTLIFEVGKAYQTRDGRKAVCLTTTLDGKFRIGFQMDGTLIVLQTNGMYYTDKSETPNDIISEWIDKPIVDWSLMPAWAKFVAMDKGGKWYWYTGKPNRQENQWYLNYNQSTRIPTEYCPKWDGDWRQSLTERP
jgi:hypothetical protein